LPIIGDPPAAQGTSLSLSLSLSLSGLPVDQHWSISRAIRSADLRVKYYPTSLAYFSGNIDVPFRILPEESNAKGENHVRESGDCDDVKSTASFQSVSRFAADATAAGRIVSQGPRDNAIRTLKRGKGKKKREKKKVESFFPAIKSGLIDF